MLTKITIISIITTKKIIRTQLETRLSINKLKY